MMSPEQINRPLVLAEVTAAFYRYEEALVSNDIAVLDELFWHDKRTVRLGAGENLYGIDEIRAFRAARPAAGLQRELRHTIITTFGEDYAVCSTDRFAASPPGNTATLRDAPGLRCAYPGNDFTP